MLCTSYMLKTNELLRWNLDYFFTTYVNYIWSLEIEYRVSKYFWYDHCLDRKTRLDNIQERTAYL